MNKAFNAEMLVLARESRGLTQVQLAEAMRGRMSQAKLSKIENGLVAPSDEDVTLLAEALRYRPSFFLHPYMRRASPATYHRKRQKLSKSDWDRIFARAEIYRIAIATFLRSVELAPKFDSPPAIDTDEYGGRIEEIALAIRQLWTLPRGPIADVSMLLESAGIVIVEFDFGTELCDGFSQHRTDDLPAFIFANKRQPKDKLRFTLAHELGHLVMHRLPKPEMEDEANRFASEFLMPSEDIRKDFHSLSLEKFMALKMYWKTSMQSIIMKAYSLGRISESNYRYYMTQMAKRGWRTHEPVALENGIENPRVVRQLVNAHIQKLDYSFGELSQLLGIYEQEFESVYSPNPPRLRLVV